eukprot:350807-Chlamydomonas_euryale.AAC.2
MRLVLRSAVHLRRCAAAALCTSGGVPPQRCAPRVVCRRSADPTAAGTSKPNAPDASAVKSRPNRHAAPDDRTELWQGVLYGAAQGASFVAPRLLRGLQAGVLYGAAH